VTQSLDGGGHGGVNISNYSPFPLSFDWADDEVPSGQETVSQSFFCHCERLEGAWQSLYFQSVMRLLRSFHSLAMTFRHSPQGRRNVRIEQARRLSYTRRLSYRYYFTTDTYTPIERKPIPSWKCFPDDEPIGVLAETSVKIPLNPPL